MILQLKNIYKNYPHAETGEAISVLNGISLSLNSGDSIAITGPSGCGKTTLLNIIGTLDSPSSGEVILLDKNISTFNEQKLALVRNQTIGFVFQQHHLLPQLTAMENVLMPASLEKDRQKRKDATERAIMLLEMVGLADRSGNRPAQLSTGQCQRIAVVRALINKPALLLADEPTGSLDQDSAIQIGELLIKIRKEQNPAIIVATHSPEMAAIMGKQYRLIRGNLVVT